MKGLIITGLLLIAISLHSQETEIDSVVGDSIYYENDYYEGYEDRITEETDYDLANWGMMFLDLKMNFPIKNNENSYNTKMFGFDLGVFKQLRENSTFHFGGGVSMGFYGGETFTYFDYSPENGYEYQYQQDFTGSILNIYVGSKYFTPKSFWIFNPYVNFDVEYRYAFAYYNITNLDLDNVESSEYQKSDYGFGYNIGIGSLIYVSNENFFLDFSANYKSGGGLFLYQKNPDNMVLNSVMDFYDYNFFPINFLTLKIGFVYRG